MMVLIRGNMSPNPAACAPTGSSVRAIAVTTRSRLNQLGLDVVHAVRMFVIGFLLPSPLCRTTLPEANRGLPDRKETRPRAGGRLRFESDLCSAPTTTTDKPSRAHRW